MIFVELVRSGQGKAETERSRLVWAIRALRKSQQPVFHLRFLCSKHRWEKQEGEGGQAKIK